MIGNRQRDDENWGRKMRRTEIVAADGDVIGKKVTAVYLLIELAQHIGKRTEVRNCELREGERSDSGVRPH